MADENRIAPDRGSGPGLEVTNLSVERGGRRILSDLSFTVTAGEALLVRGPNGSGKTTLLRTIAGFLSPISGHIRLTGDEEQPLTERIHYVGHLNGVRASLTVEENVRFWARYLGGSEDRVSAALERFGLASLASIPTGYLSAGQRRRLALVRPLLAFRPLWLLDEPSTSLDARSTAVLAEAIDEHVSSGGIVVAATHLELGIARSRELRLGFAAEQA